MKIKNLLLSFTLGLTGIACEVQTDASTSTDLSVEGTINESVLSGEVAGRSWTFISGRARPSSFDDDYSFSFWSEDIVDPCGPHSIGSDSQLMGTFTLEEGTQMLGNLNNINFSSNSQNNIATSGRMVITEIEADVVHGEMIATFDDENFVNGTFEITLCD